MEGCFSFFTCSWQNPAALPIFDEQHRIVAEVELHLSVADEMGKTVEQSLKQAERLYQSILKRAFGGKLVPREPDEEQAGVLLERIKVEKTQREKVKVKRKVKCTMELNTFTVLTKRRYD